MLTDQQRRFLAGQRVARLATADAAGRPHVVPICYALRGNTVYFTIDEKPKKRPGARLKRLANLQENPSAALVVDRYDEDWSRLGWVMVRGRADILESGPEHDRAQATPARPLSPARRRCASKVCRWSPCASTTPPVGGCWRATERRQCYVAHSSAG